MYRIVIPARYASSRLPGKPLLAIAGRPMLEWVYGRARSTRAAEIVIATDDERIERVARAFGAEVDHREVVERDGVEEALLKVAESYVQLLTPTRPDSPVAKALEKRGEGLHHIGYRVDDCQVALDAMLAAGATAIDSAPRPGSRGTTVAFIHPKGSFGTLIELVQE